MSSALPAAKPSSRFTRALRRMTASNAELESQELLNVATKAGATPIGTCHDRQRVRIRGTITVVTVNPRSEHKWLEASVKDGSGVVTCVWMGRRTLPGIEAGRALIVEGIISCVEGRRTIYNPRYELLP